MLLSLLSMGLLSWGLATWPVVVIYSLHIEVFYIFVVTISLPIILGNFVVNFYLIQGVRKAEVNLLSLWLVWTFFISLIFLGILFYVVTVDSFSIEMQGMVILLSFIIVYIVSVSLSLSVVYFQKKRLNSEDHAEV